MTDIRTHKRVINTFTGPAEKKLLIWMASKLPAWFTPDVLTAIGVIGALVSFASYWVSGSNRNYLWLASLGFVINWFGDSLDGTVARYRHIERPVYGYYIDHAVDAYIVVLFLLGLGLSPYVSFSLACLLLIGYLLLTILVHLRTTVRGEFIISYGKLGPTEARLIGIGSNTLIYFLGYQRTITLFSVSLGVYDWIVVALTLLVLGICLATTFKQAVVLATVDKQTLAERENREQVETDPARQNVKQPASSQKPARAKPIKGIGGGKAKKRRSTHGAARTGGRLSEGRKAS